MKHYIFKTLPLLVFWHVGLCNLFCQDIKTPIPLEYVIYSAKINLHFQDSILPFTLFTDPNISFYFQPGFVAKPDLISDFFLVKNQTYRVVYSPMTDSIVNIDCLCPRLISHDSVLLNESPVKFIEIPNSCELEYSYILKNLKETGLYDYPDKRAIRIIVSFGYGCYTAIRLEIMRKYFAFCEVIGIFAY